MQFLNDKAQNILRYFWQIWVCASHDVQHLVAIKIQIRLKSSNSKCQHLYNILHVEWLAMDALIFPFWRKKFPKKLWGLKLMFILICP